jgi:2-epi-5-epi-valiolone synthase
VTLNTEIVVAESEQHTPIVQAERLAAKAGGPPVRAVVLLDPCAGIEPVIVARYPRLVIQMSRASAVAYSAPSDWSRFLVLQSFPEPQATAFWRTPAEVHGQKLKIDSVADVTPAARLLGIEHCILVSETDEPLSSNAPFPHLLLKDHSAVITGATHFAGKLLSQQGVRHTSHTSRLTVPRTVSYSILRPTLPVFDPQESALSEVVGSRPVLFVSDLNLAALYASGWRHYAQQRLRLAGELLLQLSESSKAWDQVHDICGYALRCELPRNGVIVAVGGGVTLDVAGFAASIFRRGIPYIRIPTSLIGLIDVSVGIKQGVNSHGKKNLLGSFYPPLASINDYRFLKTLPVPEFPCGMAEILKMALLRDPVLLEHLEQIGHELLASRFSNPPSLAREVLLRSELLMMEELAPNLFEETFSRLVDFGHTFSPTIETASQYRIPHGRAVALDILLSTALATVLGYADRTLLKRLITLFPRLGLPVWHDLMPPPGVLFDALPGVECHRGGSLNLVVVAEPGRPRILQSLSGDDLASAFDLWQCTIPFSDTHAPFTNQTYARTAV